MTMATTTGQQVEIVSAALVRNADVLAELLRQVRDPTPRAIVIGSIGEMS